LLSRAVLGVGVAFIYTGVTVLIYELYRGEQMDRAFGLRTGANSVGAAVWPLVGGALGVVSWQAPFGVYLVAIPLAVVAIVAIPETGDRTGGGAGDDASARRSGILEVLRRRPALLGVYLVYFVANALLYAIVVFYPQLLSTVGVDSAFGVGLYLSANGAAGGVSGALYDRLKAAVGARRLVFGAFALWVVAFGLATAVASPIAAVAPVVLFGLGLGVVFPSTFVWVEALAPATRRGQFSSYVAMAGYVGQFVAPIGFGALVGPFGIRGPFAAAAVTATVGAAAFAAIALAGRDR
jgi:MFS family permease